MNRINWENKKEELEDLIVAKKISYEEIGRMYNVSGTCIRKNAKKLGINTHPRRSINSSETFNKGKQFKAICEYCGKEFISAPAWNSRFCSRECWTEAKKKDNVEKWKSGEHNGTKAFNCASFVRDYMLRKANYKCENCGWGEENPFTHRIPLQIHHIDGNSLNNTESNLQVLCPNCHSLTENFGSRNKNAPNGKSKYYRRS